MKNVLLLAAFAVGATGFGGEVSDFERGFLEGKASCQTDAPPTSGVVCTVPETKFFGSRVQTGRTKAEALLKVEANVLSAAYSEGKPPVCITF